jgi:hypothetical protein
MDPPFSVRRFPVITVQTLFSIVLLATTSNASGGNITYNFVDYPANETDLLTHGTDTISGTIITNGKIGLLTTADIVGGTFTYTNPVRGSDSFSVNGSINRLAGVSASSSSITLAGPFGFGNLTNEFVLSSTVGPRNVAVFWQRAETAQGGSSSPSYQNSLRGSVSTTRSTGGGGVIVTYLSQFGASDQAPPGASALLGGTDPWVIATNAPVPEPSSTVLLCAGVATFLVYGWRKQIR